MDTPKELEQEARDGNPALPLTDSTTFLSIFSFTLFDF